MPDGDAVGRSGSSLQLQASHPVYLLCLVLCVYAPIAEAAQTACAEQVQFKTLIDEGENRALSHRKQRDALESAIHFCPSEPQAYRLLSVLLMKDGAIPAALEWIDRGLQQAPGDPGLQFSRGVALLSSGRAVEALAILQHLTSDAKTDFYIGMAHRKLGETEKARSALMRSFDSGYQDPYVLYVVIEQDRLLGDKKAGLDHFQILDQRFPHSAYLHLLLGDAHLDQKNDTEAEREYREALLQDSSLPMVHAKLGFLEFSRARYAEAADLFRNDIALNSDFAESYVYLGLCLRRLGNNTEAIRAFEQAITRDPNSLNGYRQLATALMQEGKLPDAVRVLQNGTKRFPKDEAIQAQLAHALARSGQADQGGKAADRARELREQNARTPPDAPRGPLAESATAPSPAKPHPAGDSTLSGALKCVEAGDAGCAEAALAAVPDEEVRRSASFLEIKAQVLQMRRKYTEALTAIQQAIAKDPGQSRLLVLQGELYQKSGDQVSAIRSFLESQKLGDQSAVPVYSIGMCFFALGYHDDLKEYYDRASRHFRVALQLDPRFSKAEFMLGVIDAVEESLPEARNHFEKALELDPHNGYYHLHYGVLLNRIGENDEAFRQLQQANQLLPASAPVHLNLGKMYAHLNRYADARTELEAAVRLNPALAEAFYTLGDVYRHLGLESMSKSAFDNFRVVKKQNKEIDPLEASITMHRSAAGEQNP